MNTYLRNSICASTGAFLLLRHSKKKMPADLSRRTPSISAVRRSQSSPTLLPIVSVSYSNNSNSPRRTPERNASPRRVHPRQAGRSLPKEKIRRQREEEKKPRFLIGPSRLPFHLFLESQMLTFRSAFVVSRTALILHTPKNSLVNE